MLTRLRTPAVTLTFAEALGKNVMLLPSAFNRLHSLTSARLTPSNLQWAGTWAPDCTVIVVSLGIPSLLTKISLPNSGDDGAHSVSLSLCMPRSRGRLTAPFLTDQREARPGQVRIPVLHARSPADNGSLAAASSADPSRSENTFTRSPPQRLLRRVHPWRVVRDTEGCNKVPRMFSRASRRFLRVNGIAGLVGVVAAWT